MNVWEALLFTRAVSVQNVTGQNEPITWPLIFLLGALSKKKPKNIKTQMNGHIVTYNLVS